jgi:CBS domain-containing protein
MNAADVMVSNVITVGPAACVQDVAAILLKNRISAVPVVGDQGELLGIVSEGDLMHRPEAGTELRRSWWLEFMASNEILASEYVKTHARRITDVMTRKVITASPDTPLNEIARLLEKYRIKRVPIVQSGKIVGIVSRANLLQALASLQKEQVPATAPDDTAIRTTLMAGLKAEPWAHTLLMNATVQNGTVDLWGMVTSPAEKKAVRVLAEGIPGVRAVNDNLLVRPVMSGD